eukprot:856647-Prymnesium_polylepis.1
MCSIAPARSEPSREDGTRLARVQGGAEPHCPLRQADRGAWDVVGAGGHYALERVVERAPRTAPGAHSLLGIPRAPGRARRGAGR